MLKVLPPLPVTGAGAGCILDINSMTDMEDESGKSAEDSEEPIMPSTADNDEENLVDDDDQEEDLQICHEEEKTMEEDNEDKAADNAPSVENDEYSFDDVDEEKKLPDCKMKRRYICAFCESITSNPRKHLYHLREEHGQHFTIFECPKCIYASKHLQKLQRHADMVHKMKIKSPSEVAGKKRSLQKSTKVAYSTKPKRNPKITKALKSMWEDEDELVLLKEENEDLPESGGGETLRRKFFRCSKCDYVTHVKARYTKHLKYHDLPIQKCQWCDFRTTYRWNMDRHNKNHMEDTGEFKCSLCNFSASIKQSLTFHVSNHHLTPDKLKDKELKGCLDEDYCGDEDEEMGPVKMGKDGFCEDNFRIANIDLSHPDGSSHSENSNDGESGHSKRKKIKITLKKMKPSSEINEKHSFQDDFVHPDDVVQRRDNVYIKSLKCSFCSYKAAFKTDVLRHEQKAHGCSRDAVSQKMVKSPKNDDDKCDNNFDVEGDAFKNGEIEEIEKIDESSKDTSPSKKKSNFFNILQEKLSMSNVQNLVCQFCDHESKCLSESVRHQKLHLSAKNIYASASFSTRCQFCRHRCKTTDDLVNHLKVCPEARKNQVSEAEETENKSSSREKHPMENRVFVWNNIGSDDKEEKAKENGKRFCNKKVYSCRKCNYWSSTASRFHLHMVNHYNTKPYTCSECGYQSNWPWDTTKHIKMKVSKNQGHATAEMIITDETGEKNYDKYDKYLSYMQIEEGDAIRGEGGNCKPLNNCEGNGSPSPPLQQKPPMVSIPVSSQLPGLPPLTRAPRPRTESPGLSNNEPGGEPPSKKPRTNNCKPPPLMAFGNKKSGGNSAPKTNMISCSSGQYEIITPQGSVNTSLETLQRLASGSADFTNLAKLQSEISERGGDAGDTDVASQMRLLAWLQCIVQGYQPQEDKEAEDKQNEPQLVLDHQGSPEWKCSICTFRDSEKETVSKHISLAHNRGLVSLVHAVHRCDVCGFAAGTKRHVQLHIDNAHRGQGGITSRSEGQNPEEYSGKDLFDHLSVHGMEIPPEARNSSGLARSGLIEKKISDNDEHGTRVIKCDSCPYETRSRQKLMGHKQFHKPRGLPFKCPHCSYNVTRRHLLNQHVRMHGVSPNSVLPDADSTPSCGKLSNLSHGEKSDRSDSPSPSLTITPVRASGSAVEEMPLPSEMPLLPDSATTHLKGIPLVWVSKDSRYIKMFKCRHCPHVNVRKTNIQEHEKMHRANTNQVVSGKGHRCPHCTYICINAGVLTTHLKVHAGSMGTSHGFVIPRVPDNDQLIKLASNGARAQKEPIKASDEKLLYYCQHCPARFFLEKEIQIHSKFHVPSGSLPFTCEKCTYGARQQPHLLAHFKVHTPEYKERTRTLMSLHPSAPAYPHVPGLSVPLVSEPSSVDVGKFCKESSLSGRPVHNATPPLCGNNELPQPPPTSRFKCDKCPASFSKPVTLQYHQSLHGADNSHKCHRCSYAAKTQDALQQHTALHIDADLQNAAKTASLETDRSSLKVKRAIENQIMNKTSYSLSDSFLSSQISPLKLKLFNTKGSRSNGTRSSRSSSIDMSLDEEYANSQFKYYEEQEVPLSGIDLLKRKTQIEQTRLQRVVEKKDSGNKKGDEKYINSAIIGNKSFNYPPHIDRATGRAKQKKFKCVKCPSAFQKLEHYTHHATLHGAKNKFKCRICNYSVKFYANYKMHSERHKYHERVEAENKGLPPPPEDSKQYEPVIRTPAELAYLLSEEEKENLEKGRNTPELTTAEKQQLILQDKKMILNDSRKEEERKVFYCQYCPYASLRRDAVDSHSYRHRANGAHGVYDCTFCDYTASQPNFIKEHTKCHFRPFKYLQSEGFMKHDKQEVYSLNISDTETHEKSLTFSHEDGVFAPVLQSVKEEEDDDAALEYDPVDENGISVNFFSGDIVAAPADFVIALRPPKAKGNPTNIKISDQVEEEVIKTEATSNVEVQSEAVETEVTSNIAEQPDAVKTEDSTEEIHTQDFNEEPMDVAKDERSEVTDTEKDGDGEMEIVIDEPFLTNCVETTSEIRVPEFRVNGHIVEENDDNVYNDSESNDIGKSFKIIAPLEEGTEIISS